jgi:hypothetical protein
MKDWGAKRIHQELVITLGGDTDGMSQSKIWFQKFGNSDFFCKDVPRARLPPFIRRAQLKTFLEKYPFASAREIEQHFLAASLCRESWE